MTTKTSLLNVVVGALFTLLLVLPRPSYAVPVICDTSDPNALAVTCGFTPTDGQPAEATTGFVEGGWDAPGTNLVTVAMHELFHGIGFAAAYDLFFDNLFATPGAGANGIPVGSRVFSTSAAPADILMVLTPAGQGTHADPNATGAAPWPVGADGYNQANDIMQPTYINNPLTAQTVKVLDAAFAWSNGGIDITLNNLTPLIFSPAEIAAITQAVNNIEGFFDDGQPGNENLFTWHVYETPEPATLVLMLAGLTCLVAWRRWAS